MDFSVTYISNSGFLFETDTHIFLMDYEGGRPELVNEKLLSKGKKLIALASHGHGDHFSREILTFGGKPDAAVILAAGMARDRHALYMAPLDKLEVLGVNIEAYGSTDLGVSFMLEINGARIFHAGDYNFWHWKGESTPEEVDEARAAFDSILATIKKPVDIAFFPVDPRLGAEHDIGADVFLAKLAPRIFFPMHFRDSIAAAYAFREKHGTISPKTKIIPLTKPGEIYGGTL